MEFTGFIIKFVILTIFVSGIVVAFLYYALVVSTDGAVKRLKDEEAKASEKQSEYSRKLKEAEAELSKRQAEAKALSDKMRGEAEETSKAEREKIINLARKEGEEIIARAQGAKDKIRQEIEKEMDVRIVDFSSDILNNIIGQKAKGVLNDLLVNEFIENLANVDMSRIGLDVMEVDVISVAAIDDKIKNKFSEIIKQKLNRDVTIKTSVDPNVGGGVILKFGSLALDGTIRNAIREAGINIKAQIERR